VFGVGPTEMIVVAIVALMLFSPKELPKMLRTVARFWGQLRATADEFKDTIMHADGVDELQEIVKGGKKQLRDAENAAKRELMKARADMRRAQQKLMTTNKAKAEIRKQEQVEEATDEDGSEAPAESGGGEHGAFGPAPEAAVPASAYEAAERGRLFKEAQAKREAAVQEAAAKDVPKPPAVPPPPPTTATKRKSDANQGAA
jgi:sec-independent protein translocase protein TatB